MSANEFKAQCEQAIERFMDGLYTTDDVVQYIYTVSERYKREENS